MKKWLTPKVIYSIALILLLLAAGYGWQRYQASQVDELIVSGNGRLEATEVKVAAKMSGRVQEILVNEGDLVSEGAVLAKMDMSEQLAQLHQAQAQVSQSKADVVMAEATLMQRKTELDLARRTTQRSQALLTENAISVQEADNDSARARNAQALVAVAQAQIVTSKAGVEAAQAAVARLQSTLDDGVLRAPRPGRIQFRVAQPGEVVSNGGSVLSLVDLQDVYMTFYLPSAMAGRVPLGAEVRLVLDALPNAVIPAKVSFVASVAQFTPKMVETQSEREKLVFRVKARIAPELLSKYIAQVKTGVPGVAYVKLDAKQAWPAHLVVNVK